LSQLNEKGLSLLIRNKELNVVPFCTCGGMSTNWVLIFYKSEVVFSTLKLAIFFYFSKVIFLLSFELVTSNNFVAMTCVNIILNYFITWTNWKAPSVAVNFQCVWIFPKSHLVSSANPPNIFACVGILCYSLNLN